MARPWLDGAIVTNQNSCYMKTPKQKRSRETLRRILAAATELFEFQGVEATGMSEVAREAGSSVGSVYGRFEGKVDLVLAVDRMLWEAVKERWAAPDRDAPEATPGTEALLDQVGDALEHRHQARMSTSEFLEKNGRSSIGPGILNEIEEDVRAALAAEVATDAGAGEPDVLTFLAHLIVSKAAAPETVPAGVFASGEAASAGEERAALQYVVDATLAALGGPDRADVGTARPKKEEIFDIWA